MLINEIFQWMIKNYLQVVASLIGLIGVYYGIKEKPVFWILSNINSFLFVFVYFNNKIYALMLMQFMYITIGFIGFFHWYNGNKTNKAEHKLPIESISKKQIFIFVSLFVFSYILITFLLKEFTDSKVYYIDGLMSTFAIVASIMMMRKILQNWFVWMVSDIVTITFFFTQKMYAVMIMYSFLFLSSLIGYLSWNKEYKKHIHLMSNENSNL